MPTASKLLALLAAAAPVMLVAALAYRRAMRVSWGEVRGMPALHVPHAWTYYTECLHASACNALACTLAFLEHVSSCAHPRMRGGMHAAAAA